ncbi:ABC transporter ATP-binding protein [bacterium]|nr:ABC transporter ATP-binding protein [bacterium]
MRNYWRYLAYVWKYKVKVIFAFVAGFFAEALNFASFSAMVATTQIFLSLRYGDGPGAVAEHSFFDNDTGRWIIQFLTERATPELFLRTLLLMSLAFLVVVVIRGVLDYLRNYLLQGANLQGWTDIFNDLFARISTLSMRFFTSKSHGETMSTFGADVNELLKGGRLVFSRLVRDPFLFVGGLIYTFAIDVRLSLVTYIVLPASFWVIRWVGRHTKRYTKKSLKERADTMRVLGETLQGAAVIKAYGAEDYQVERFRDSAEKMRHFLLRRIMVRALADPLSRFLYRVAFVGVILYGAHLVDIGRLTITDLVVFLYCVKQVYDPLSRLRKTYASIQQCTAAADRVFLMLDLESEIQEKADAADLAPFHSEIAFDGVSFGYEPPHNVVSDFDLRIRAGEKLAIVGENGSGKSTVMNLLLRFYDPTEGAVRMDGMDLRDATLRSLREQMGLVSQSIVLFNDTVRNNIAFGNAQYSDAEIEEAARAGLAHDFIVDELSDGYDTMVGEGGAKLSGGQRQRVALARALLRKSPILVMDEATSALDVEAEDQLQQVLMDYAEGHTVLLVSHRFSALRYVDRIVVMRDGRIEQIGTHAELVQSSPTYANLFHKQGTNLEL